MQSVDSGKKESETSSVQKLSIVYFYCSLALEIFCSGGKSGLNVENDNGGGGSSSLCVGVITIIIIFFCAKTSDRSICTLYKMPIVWGSRKTFRERESF